MELTNEEKTLVENHRAEKKPKWKPRPASEYTAEEKAAAFDKFHKLAMEQWETRQKDSFGVKDMEHWCYEQVMELLGEGVWKAMP